MSISVLQRLIDPQTHSSSRTDFLIRPEGKAFLDSDCTHLLQIDSDQGWPAEAAWRLLETRKDFICGAVPIKDPDCENYALAIHTNQDRTPVVESGLLKADRIGTAFMLTSRKVFDCLKHPDIQRKGYYGFFDIAYDEEGRFIGEDMAFCARWRALDGEIFIEGTTK